MRNPKFYVMGARLNKGDRVYIWYAGNYKLLRGMKKWYGDLPNTKFTRFKIKPIFTGYRKFCEDYEKEWRKKNGLIDDSRLQKI